MVPVGRLRLAGNSARRGCFASWFGLRFGHCFVRALAVGVTVPAWGLRFGRYGFAEIYLSARWLCEDQRAV